MNRNMGSTALKRLMTEYRELTLHAPEGITAGTAWHRKRLLWPPFYHSAGDLFFNGIIRVQLL